MTYHILHITTQGACLCVDKGFFVAKFKEESDKRIALADLRAIIIATHGVSFTNECLSRLIENDIAILHCNNKYKPVGWTMPLDRVIRDKAFENQLNVSDDFKYKLWKIIINQKFSNQIYILEKMCIENKLYELANKPLANEANISKQFWHGYFTGLGNPQNREHENAETFENICLNYGYAVISTLVYRSVLIHGLLPNIGIHHMHRYRSVPLVYDLVEALRGFIEFYLYEFKRESPDSFEDENLKEWSKFISEVLRKCRINYKNSSYKLMDIVDIYVNSLV